MFEAPTKIFSGVALVALILIFTLLTPAAGAGERMPLPEGVFYYQPAATVFGVEATWVNPAGLADYNAAAFQVIADLSDDSFAKSWGAAVIRDRTGLAYRRVDNPEGDDWQEYVLAGGMKLGQTLSFGGSYRYYLNGGHNLKHDHFWNLGIIGGMGGTFKYGAVFSNLNRSHDADGNETEIEQRYSLGYRPMGRALTLAVDVLLSTGMSLSDADYIYHAEYETRNGIYLNGFYDSNDNFQIGVRVNLARYITGAKATFDNGGGHRRTSFFFGGTSLRQASVVPSRQRRLAVGVAGSVRENPVQPVFGRERTSFTQLILAIYRAAEDRSVGELVLSLDRLAIGFAQAQELRAAIEQFRAQGKRVTCHVSYPSNISYYVASAADQVLIPPVSQLRLVGLRAELTFWAGTLDKLGVKAEILQCGRYKTGAETYSRSESTAANREQLNRYLDDLYDQFVSAIARGRSLPADSIKAIIDRGPLTSVQALEFGLVDGLSYRDKMKKDFLEPMPEIAFRPYLADTLANDGWPPAPEVAVVVADGEIASSSESVWPFQPSENLTPGIMKAGYNQATTDPEVRGVVLRVNSPGGQALAAEEMYHAGQMARERLPIVVSMANIAASGGFHISMPASTIYSDEATMTGSIGVYGGKVDFSGLYDKVGLTKELYVRGKYAGMLSMSRPFTDEERAKYQASIDAFYEYFVGLVADSRGLPKDSVAQIAQGQVWTGREAQANGLVDSLGGLHEAIEYTAARLGLEDYRVVVYPERRSWLQLPVPSVFRWLSRTFWSGSGSDAGLAEAAPFEEGLYTRLPYDITIE